jgi:MFS family permease
VVYGVYNVAWAIGLVAGPAIGGFLLERIGFGPLTIGWSLLLLVTGVTLARLR